MEASFLYFFVDFVGSNVFTFELTLIQTTVNFLLKQMQAAILGSKTLIKMQVDKVNNKLGNIVAHLAAKQPNLSPRLVVTVRPHCQLFRYQRFVTCVSSRMQYPLASGGDTQGFDIQYLLCKAVHISVRKFEPVTQHG